MDIKEPSLNLKFNPEEVKNVSRSFFRMPKAEERFLVSTEGSPVAQYFQVILIQVKSADDEEYVSLDISNMPKNVFTLKREILKTLGFDVAHAAEYRMRKINYEGVFKIKNDHDVVNLRHDNKVEVVREIEKQSFTPKEKIENVEEIRQKRLERMNNHGGKV